MELTKLTITETQKGIRNGDFTPHDVLASYQDCIQEKNTKLNAFLEVFDDVESVATDGPLAGIPIALKDNILVKGKIASAASKILENHVAAYDATVTSKLKAAGAVIIGRTNMDEFAMGASTEQSAFGPTKNPHDLSRVPGGSSGGSVAAVAGGLALGALGSDTGGSIRQPAALCGVVGLKPTYGAVSRHGLIALGSSLDCIGPVTKTVSDAEILFDVIKGKDALDATTIDTIDYPRVKDTVKKIGVPTKFLEESGIREDVLLNFKNAIEHLRGLGYEIVDIELPNVSYAVPVYYIVLPAEASANLARFDGMRYGLSVHGDNLLETYRKTRGEGFGPEPRRRIILGTYVLSAGYYDAYYNRAQAVRRMMGEDFTKAFNDVDVIATPTTAGPAFKIGAKVADPVQMYLEDMFTAPANLTGLPAMSVPSGTITEDDVSLPLGLQLIAPHLHEHLLFEVGKKFETSS